MLNLKGCNLTILNKAYTEFVINQDLVIEIFYLSRWKTYVNCEFVAQRGLLSMSFKHENQNTSCISFEIPHI